MSNPKVETSGAVEEESDSEVDDVDQSIAALRMANDVEGLLALAKQYRSGSGVPRDMQACLKAYVAAGDLGSPVAQHAAGLFYLNGGVVPRDEREAALRFRAAADQGHLPAKVLVANLYELGIHYRADAAKADVWYRNAARSAAIEAEPGTPEYARAIADLGAVRYCLEISEDPETSADERARLIKVARAYGYRPPGDAARVSELPQSIAYRDPEGTPAAGGPIHRSTPVPSAQAVVNAQAAGAPRQANSVIRTEEAKPLVKAPAKKANTKLLPKANVGLGATAFLFSLVFAALGLVLGHALRNLGIDMLAKGGVLPVVGNNVELILPLFVGVLAVLPNLLVYKPAAFLKAAIVSSAAGIAAEVLWGMGNHFLETRVMQITDFAAVGLLVGLLLFGLFGGAKAGSR